MNYYNDSDPFAVQWLRNLVAGGFIPAGCVDERDIREVEPGDLRGFAQCHFFAGIGGWAYALQLAGWDPDRPVWTGSCPCQPFSSAGRQGGALDERHLWPRWLRLIRECRPDAILGEQVEGAVGFGWVDRVFADLETENFTCGAAVLGAHSVGAPHIRQRLFWVALAEPDIARAGGVAEADRGAAALSGGLRVAGGVADADAAGSGRQRRQGLSGNGDAPQRHDADRRGAAGGLADADIDRHQGQDLADDRRPRVDAGGEAGGLEHSAERGLQGIERGGSAGARGFSEAVGERCSNGGGMGLAPCEQVGRTRQPWQDSVWLPCLDGKARRVVAALQPLAHAGECICGLRLGELCACGERRPSRVGMLRGSGNAIVSATAAAFIEAVMEVCP